MDPTARARHSLAHLRVESCLLWSMLGAARGVENRWGLSFLEVLPNRARTSLRRVLCGEMGDHTLLVRPGPTDPVVPEIGA